MSRIFDDRRPTDGMARKFVKDECGAEIAISKGSGRSYARNMHIPDGDGGVICPTWIPGENHWERKDLAIYPPESKPWCAWCLAIAFPEYSDIDLSKLGGGV